MIAHFLQPVLMHPNRGMDSLIASRLVRNIGKQFVERGPRGKSLLATKLTIPFNVAQQRP